MRIVGLRVLLVCAVVASMPCDRAYAITRRIFDCGDPNGDTVCYLDFLDEDYFFGRSEGQPPRGPNPLNMTTPNGGNVFGSTDVDTLYDLTGQIHQYYTTVLGRDGPNGLGGTGNGTTVPSNVYRLAAHVDFSDIGADCNVPTGTPSAAATTTTCLVCKGSATPDIVAHELAHIMFNKAIGVAPPSFNEFGALNEAVADFFGEAFERFLTGDMDWILGTGHAIPNRSIADPTSIRQSGYPTPDRYLHPDFYIGTDDNGGTHINAGILNKASYLAVEGGSFNGFEIGGIGFDKVEQIWYRALTTYFEPNETFNQAYEDILQAATDLYGPEDVWEVTKALRSVEMHLSRDGLRGDYNADGAVDAADYLVARKQVGTYYTLGAIEDWRIHFGMTSGGGANSTVPEPAGWVLVVAALSCAGGLRIKPRPVVADCARR